MLQGAACRRAVPSWDPGLAERAGAVLGRECRAEGVDVPLGPGINTKRSPLGGRNFEYFSADPLLTAAMATAWSSVTGARSPAAPPRRATA